MPSPEERTAKSDDEPSSSIALGLIVCSGATFSGLLLDHGKTVDIGRGTELDLTIDHDSVSRRHAQVEWIDGAPMLRDLESTNGTRVDGKRLEEGERVRLRIGASVLIGRVPVLVQPADVVRTHVRRGSLTSAAPPPPAPSQAPTGVIVRDPKMTELFAMLEVIAPSDIPILVLGETGCGKEVFASSIHRLSLRSARPFLALSCVSLPESLLESELFGHERGAFTGATQAKPGLFEAADGGTLFLDEIGEMTLATQAKLLRVLESGEVMRIGSVRPKRVDVRIVSATNRDLEQRISEGHFRADLFFRVNGITMRLPPLRERPLDVEALAQHFVHAAASKQGHVPLRIGEAALSALRQHPWPGNVRELRNVMQRACVLCRGDVIELEHLGLETSSTSAPVLRMTSSSSSSIPTAATAAPAAPAGDLRKDMESFERERIVRALEDAGGNQTRAAKTLGIARRTLITKLEQYGIARPRKT